MQKTMKRAMLGILIGMLLWTMAGAAAADPMPTLEPPQPLRSAKIRAVGDVMAHERQLDMALQSDGSYDFTPQFALIADSLADADYTIANLETTIGGAEDAPFTGFPAFNTPENLLDVLRDAGVDFLTLANNHILDRYFQGLTRTVDKVEERGFAHAGANRSQEERDAPVVVHVNGIAIGLLSYTVHTNGNEAAILKSARGYCVNYLRKANYKKDVERLREAGAEFIIALPHWGQEYFRKPEDNTVAQAKRMIAAGVDVVLGSHPHMVQPVRYVEAVTDAGEARTGLVVYSMGNFISNMSKHYTDSGIIVEFTIQEQQDGGFGVADVGIVPTYCWRRDDCIQTLPSQKYYDAPPEGMSDERFAAMRESWRELRELIDGEFPFLDE